LPSRAEPLIVSCLVNRRTAVLVRNLHEPLSTKAILETLKGHKRDKQTDMFDLFGDPQHS